MALLTVLVLGGINPLAGQEDRLLQRWVGTHLGRPIFLDFYGDSLVVVNDHHVADFWHSRDSLNVFGDTTFAVRYEFRYDKMLIENAEGNIVTMSPQSLAARPVYGALGGQWGRWAGNTLDGRQLVVEMRRIGNLARWRWGTSGGWTNGTWTRSARTFVFAWGPDSTEWRATYDAPRALIFEETQPGSGLTILRRSIRR